MKDKITMLVLLFLFTLFILFLSLYSSLFKGRFFSRHSAVIDAPIDILSEDLSDLANWKSWLPWLMYDKDIDIFYEYPSSGVRAVLPSCLIWRGDLTKENHLSLQPSRSSAHYFHTLLEAPAFYPNDVHFNIDLSKQKERTLITIQITGNLPFLKRWMGKDYKVRASKDAELALLKLLAYLAKYNAISNQEYHEPRFEYLNKKKMQKIDAVTRPFIVSNQPMSQKMHQGFHDLVTELGPDNPPAGPSFVLYKKADVIHHYFSGKLGIPIQNVVPCELCPERIVLRGDYLQLRYIGSYQNLSLAWHVLHTFRRLSKLKHNRRRYGVEVFEVSTTQTDNAKDYVTLVCLPIK
jgi:hypothetical protein